MLTSHTLFILQLYHTSITVAIYFFFVYIRDHKCENS